MRSVIEDRYSTLCFLPNPRRLQKIHMYPPPSWHSHLCMFTTTAGQQSPPVRSAGEVAAVAAVGEGSSAPVGQSIRLEQPVGAEMSEEPDDMETEIVDAARHNDPLAAYDISVSEEGIALKEFLALVAAVSSVI